MRRFTFTGKQLADLADIIGEERPALFEDLRKAVSLFLHDRNIEQAEKKEYVKGREQVKFELIRIKKTIRRFNKVIDETSEYVRDHVLHAVTPSYSRWHLGLDELESEIDFALQGQLAGRPRNRLLDDLNVKAVLALERHGLPIKKSRDGLLAKVLAFVRGVVLPGDPPEEIFRILDRAIESATKRKLWLNRSR